jgi:hypothetical protein
MENRKKKKTKTKPKKKNTTQKEVKKVDSRGNGIKHKTDSFYPNVSQQRSEYFYPNIFSHIFFNVLNSFAIFTQMIIAGGQVSGAVQFHPTFGMNEYTATGGAQTMMANRISFFLNLTGRFFNFDRS